MPIGTAAQKHPDSPVAAVVASALSVWAAVRQEQATYESQINAQQVNAVAAMAGQGTKLIRTLRAKHPTGVAAFMASIDESGIESSLHVVELVAPDDVGKYATDVHDAISKTVEDLVAGAGKAGGGRIYHATQLSKLLDTIRYCAHDQLKTGHVVDGNKFVFRMGQQGFRHPG